MKGISTIIAEIIMVVITIGLISVAYLYMSGLITGRTATNIQLLDAYCRSGNISFLIKNIGTTNIAGTGGGTVGPLTLVIRGTTITAGLTCDFSPANTITAGNSTFCKNNSQLIPATAMSSGYNEIRIIGPSNAIGGSISC
jgi:hypothetical protein